ncbi:hypothetical protein [Lacinutrix undariae]
MQYYSSITLLVEILAAVTGLLLYKRYKHTAVKYFIMFLCYVIFITLVGRYTYYVKDGIFSFLEGTKIERNYWWFTITWKIGAVYFFSWYFQQSLKRRTHVNVLKYSTYLFLVISGGIIVSDFNFFFSGSFPLISILGSAIILQCAFFFFFEILQSEAILSFHKTINFYISSAILFFWLLKTPLVFYEIYYTQSDLSYVYLRSYINLGVIIFMYLTFTFGLIISKPKK